MEIRSNNPNRLFLFFLLTWVNVFSATGGLISGISSSVTSNLYPLLWKSVDSTDDRVALVFFNDADYDHIGLVQNDDSLHVLGGLNSAGFALVFSGADSQSDAGVLTKQALGICGRVSDFREFLVKADTFQVALNTSFACMDRFGECVIIEYPEAVWDMNDKSSCPAGFCVRSDFIFSDISQGSSDFWRYHRAVELLASLHKDRNLNLSSLLSTLVRDFKTPGFDPYPLPCQFYYHSSLKGFIPTTNAINQYNTVAALVIEGVTKNSRNAYPTLWYILGNPSCSVALPIWPQTGFVPKTCAAPKAFLNSVFISKKNRLFSYNRDETLLNSDLYMKKHAGFYPKIFEFENALLAETSEKLSIWQNMNKNDVLKEMSRFQKKVVNNCTKLLR